MWTLSKRGHPERTQVVEEGAEKFQSHVLGPDRRRRCPSQCTYRAAPHISPVLPLPPLQEGPQFLTWFLPLERCEASIVYRGQLAYIRPHRSSVALCSLPSRSLLWKVCWCLSLAT